jgi:DNA repair protein RadA/Sms
MARAKSAFVCSECNSTYPKWMGKCTECGAYGTVEEKAIETNAPSIVGVKSKGTSTMSNPALRLKDISADSHKHKTTGIGEFDRVLGGGLVKGGVILLAGEPGVGKALALDTPIATPTGWSSIGELKVGDQVFGDDGLPTNVVALSEIWENRPCYEVVFSDDSKLIADENHEWATSTRRQRVNARANKQDLSYGIRTTREIKDTLLYGSDKRLNHSIESLNALQVSEKEFPPYALGVQLGNGRRYIKEVNLVDSVPVRCIEIDNYSHLFLAGKEMIPTHNSSLLATVAHHISIGSNVLYVSGEESVQQIKIRHQRMKAEGDQLYLASENDLSKVIWHIDEIKPELIIVDSVQTIASPDIDGRAGSPSQVTEVATILTRIAKERGIPLIFVGHFTKAGDVAGPRVVEHLVDVVLSFEGENDSPLRLLRGIKNRFGPADEIGCFEHTEEGLEEVADPSGLLLSSRAEPVMGVATSIFLEGKRALPIEVQALVTASVLPNPRKVTSGLDSPKTIQIQAVLEKHGGLRLSDKDVYVSTIGGMKVKETSIDLATVIALASAQLSLISRNDAVAIGEVALSGEIRRTPGINRKLAEALRLGFNVAFVPVGTKAALTPSLAASSLKVIELKNVEHAVGAVRGFAMAHEMGIDTK